MSPRARTRPATDLSAVLGAIARTAAQLCEATDALIYLVDGERHRLMAKHGTMAQPQRVGDRHPIRRDTPLGRAVLDRRSVHVPDINAARARFGGLSALGLKVKGVRTILAMPLLHDGGALGGIVIRRTRVQPFTAKQISLLKTFADQAAIAIENARLSEALEARNRELTEALEQQTASAEILKVISSTPTDAQPVFDTIIRNAVRLSGAAWGLVSRVEGGLINMAAHHNLDAGVLARMRHIWPHPVDGQGPTSRVVASGRLFRAVDIEAEDCALSAEALADFGARGIRSMLVVPMFHHGQVVGTINLTHQAVGAFSDAHVALIRTFADQAVIAIENVRLFNELQEKNRALMEALEQQTATSEILRVISSSPTDVQPVLDAVAEAAARLCSANDAIIRRVDGDMLRLWAHHGDIPVPQNDVPLTPGLAIGRAVLEKRTLHVHDAAEVQPQDEYGEIHALLQRVVPARTILVTPLVRDDVAIGVILIRRMEVRPFSVKQMQLLQTFGDQAVIAIENVRLFNELQARNRDLTTALEQQTATAEILRTISRSYTDVRPVFQAIVDSATRLLRGHSAVLSRIVDDRIDLAAYTHTDDAGDALLESFFPMPLQAGGSDVRPIRERVIGQQIPYNVADVETDPRVGERGRASARARGYRSQLVVPMLRDSEPIGTLAVTRASPARSATTRSRCCRPSRTRRASPLRTCGCSKSWRNGTAR